MPYVPAPDRAEEGHLAAVPLVTVSEVVRFALPPGGSVLAGAGGLGKSVSWARLLRARPTTIGAVEQGEVWLLSPGALHAVGDARSIARMVEEVAAAGVVGFITVEEPGQEVLEVADRAAAPLVLLPLGTPLHELEKVIVSFVVDRDRAIGQRVQQVYDRLLATLVEDRGPELLAGIVHEVCAKAVYLLDEHFQPTVQAGGNGRTAEALGQVRRRFWEAPSGALGDRLIGIRGGDGSTAGQAAVVRPLLLRGAVEGYLALLGWRDEFSDFDYLIADRTASVLAIELAKQSAVVEARLRVQGDFLEELLDNPAPLAEQLAARAKALGYELGHPHVLFVLRPRLIDDRTPTPRQFQRFVEVARRRLVLQNVATLLRERGGAIQVLAPCPPDLSPADLGVVVEWVERVRVDLEAAMQPDALPIAAGVGRSPDAAHTPYTGLREAVQAAEIAARLPGGVSTLHFASLGALRLIFRLAGDSELKAFQRDLIGPLEEYDRQHRSELVQTLDAFFRAGGNHMRAARTLHVHRNTLIYRLDRVRDLLGGAELEDPDTRLNLQLALKIRAAFGA